MVDRVQLSPEERGLVSSIRTQLEVSTDQWMPARLALARSLQLPEAPRKQDYIVQSQQEEGVTLHSRQLTGEGAEKAEDDFTDVYRALLSAYEGRDLFADDQAFHEALQRHVRRGLRVINEEAPPYGDIANYLAQELFHDDGSVPGTEPVDDELPHKIMRVLGELGIDARLDGVDVGPRLTRLTLELHAFEEFDRLRRSLENISFALGLGKDSLSVELAKAEKRAVISVPRPPAAWRTVTWSDLRGHLGGPVAHGMALPLCLGTDVLGAPFLIDLATAPHLIVAGTTGSGKSMCLHAILLSLLEGDGGKPQLVLIDPKEVEFSAYEKCAQVRGGVRRSAAEALETLGELVEEMDRRQELFRALGVREFSEARDRDSSLERIVVVVDELGDLILQSREIEIPLIRLAQKARSSGIHLVLATQRPEAATFPGMLRSNIPSRIALTVQKSSESKIILDETGAEALLMKGDMLVKMSGQPTVRAHGCRVEQADILAAVAFA